MPEISVSQVGAIADKRIKRIAEEVAVTVRLAADKATANAIDPARYPLSRRPNSLERIFSERLASLSPTQKAIATANGQARLGLSAATRRREYGRLASVNLRDRTSVEEQVQAMRVPASLRLTREYVEGAQLTNLSLAPAILRSPLLGGPELIPSRPTRLEFRVHQLYAADETGGYWEEKLGADEMYLGGSAIDATGVTSEIAKFKVANFDDGDVFTWQTPKALKRFDLTAGTDWPKTYYVLIVLAEVDMGGLAEYLNKLVDGIKEHVEEYLAALIGGAVGAASGGPIGAIIGLAVGYAVGKAIEWLKGWWGDDIFSPVTLNVEIAGYSSRWGTATDSPNVVTKITGHDGDYRLTYDWRLTNFTSISTVARA